MFETVSYDNELNKIALNNLKAMEQDLFWAIASKIKGKGNQTIEISFDEIKELSEWNGRINSESALIKDLKSVDYKLKDIEYIIDDETGYARFTLFPYFIAKDGLLKVNVSDPFVFMFTRAKEKGNFTEFDLKTIVSLSSGYSKEIYRRLMRFKSTGWFEISMEDFRQQLSIPKSYKMGNIDQKILNVAKKELVPKYLNYLEITKVKGGYKKLEIVKLRFDFESREFEDKEIMKRIGTPEAWEKALKQK